MSDTARDSVFRKRHREVLTQAGRDATAPDEAAASTVLAAIIDRLRVVAQETPEEAARRWPYHAQMQVNSQEARALLEALDAKP